MRYKPKRYRARNEHYGIEIFDRVEGIVIPLDLYSSSIIIGLALKDGKGDLQNLPEPLSSLNLFSDDGWNVEPLTDTPYPKTAGYASAPRRIYWELTRKCNLNCKSCFNRFLGGEELSIDAVTDIARQMYNAGVYEIRCTGGEPTMRPDFFEIARELAGMGFYLSMGSNGVYSPDILKKVMDSPINWIIISLDGSSEETHSLIRGKGFFDKTVKTLEKIAEKGSRIRINTLIRKGNFEYEHLKGIAEICDRFGVESLNCIPLRPLTNDRETLKLRLTREEFSIFINGLNRLREEYKTDFVTTLDLRNTNLHDRVYFKDKSCAAGREGAVISPYGELYGCSYSPASIPDAPEKARKKYVAGNLLKENFQEVWNNSKRWAIYRDLNKYKHLKCKECSYYITNRCIGNCPIMNENDPGGFDPYCYLNIE